MEQRKYGLITAITVIAGSVIGSGIFFKSYTVLSVTGGSVIQGVIAFCAAAIGIIFGGLAVGQLALRTDRPGGVINYSETFFGKKMACVYGWFHLIAYYPAFTCVIAWIGGVYLCMLFGWEGTLENQCLVAAVLITVLYALNMYNAKWGGRVQDVSVMIKLIPLLMFAVVGLLFGDPEIGINYHAEGVETSGTWLKAVPAVLFSFDGWILATTICHEIRDSKRNLPLALAITPLIILICYVAYFVGMSNYMGVENILALGSDHLQAAAEKLLHSSFGVKLILTFVVISVTGTVNGLALTASRMAYSLSIRKMFPCADKFTYVDPKHGVNRNSSLLAWALTLVLLVIHYITQKTGVMGAGDVSEISVIANSGFVIVLYVAVIRLARKGEITSIFNGYVVPILAIIGSLVCVYAGFTNPMFPWYLLGCAIVILIAWRYACSHPEIEDVVLGDNEG